MKSYLQKREPASAKGGAGADDLSVFDYDIDSDSVIDIDLPSRRLSQVISGFRGFFLLISF